MAVFVVVIDLEARLKFFFVFKTQNCRVRRKHSVKQDKQMASLGQARRFFKIDCAQNLGILIISIFPDLGEQIKHNRSSKVQN